MYMSPGAVLIGPVFQTYQAIRRYRDPQLPDYMTKTKPHRGLWHPHNVIVEGRANGMYILRYFI